MSWRWRFWRLFRDMPDPPQPSGRWAVMFLLHDDGRFSTLKCFETNISFYERAGWKLIISDSKVMETDIDDARREDEQGRR